MGSKNSKEEKKDGVNTKNVEAAQLVKQVDQYQKQEDSAHARKMKAMGDLPTVYVNAHDTKVTIPLGGARVVFRGQQGTQVKMEPAPKPMSAPRTRVIATSSYHANGAVYSVPKTVVTKNADGTTTTSTIVVRPNYCRGYYNDPYYCGDPCYYPYYGHRRYPYYYY